MHARGAEYSFTPYASGKSKNKVVILAIVGLSILSYVGQHFKALRGARVSFY